MALTPNMNLLLPTVGVTFGPEWATELNAALSLIDSHNHVVGQGVPIPTAGISLNADLAFNAFNATALRSVRMNNQPSPLALVTDLTCLYVSGNNLYYNNGAGQQVQITLGAGLNAASVGGFGGDYGTSTAAAFYTSATSTFTFWQAPNQSAIMDMGPLVLHNTDQITNGITFQAPNGLASSYTLTLPTGLPASQKILTVDASGNIGDVLDVDGSTIQISSNTLMVPAGGITDTQIATGTITVDKKNIMTVSPTAGLSDYMQTSSCGTFSVSPSNTNVPVTNLSGSIVSSGRPIQMSIQSDGNDGFVTILRPFGATASAEVKFIVNGSPAFPYLYQASLASNTVPNVYPSFLGAQLNAPAGTYTIEVWITTGAGTTFSLNNSILTAYEI